MGWAWGRGRRGEPAGRGGGSAPRVPPAPPQLSIQVRGPLRPGRRWPPPPALPPRPGCQPPRGNLGQGRPGHTHTPCSPTVLGTPPRTHTHTRSRVLGDGGDPPRTDTGHKFYFPFPRGKFPVSGSTHRHVPHGSPPFPGRGLGDSGIHSTPKLCRDRCGFRDVWKTSTPPRP
ncbi:basic proline-rich protein-like [Meriones unguiculatus]|uniref:basic proline-rich protein-like n=1 Tax=Meriones unguiculatus TaxID=10047 RepID=UPI00293F7608|nr:basic proline-rich protein-like [Meriones unguiculatus]